MPLPLSPFARTNRLLAGIEPGLPAINLTVGEPAHGVPAFVGPVLAGAVADFGRYPAIRGTDAFRSAVARWSERRFALPAGTVDDKDGVLALNGSRDGLFSAAVAAVRARPDVARPVILMPNPFYQVYAAAADIAGAEGIMLDAGPETRFLPDLSSVSDDLLARTVAVYYASPANPQGAVATAEDWRAVIELARRHRFTVLADECYSEIYRDAPPAGVLSAAMAEGGTFANVVAFNSLSKRSNLPGMRCGFAVGDPAFLKPWAEERNVYGPQVPMPAQAVAVVALADEDHVVANRKLYNDKYALADEVLRPIFGDVVPEGGFFLWLDVARFGGGEAVAADLWRQTGVRVLPGGTLAAGNAAHNPGTDYIRIAMVSDLATTGEALARMKAYFEKR